jgi:hypothetical protein
MAEYSEKEEFLKKVGLIVEDWVECKYTHMYLMEFLATQWDRAYHLGVLQGIKAKETFGL